MNGNVIIVTEDDMRWWVDGDRNGWELPISAPAWKRHWPVRYFRAFWYTFHVVRHEEMMRQFGLITGGFDRWVLYAIWRGWC